MAILQDMTQVDLQAELELLREENAKLRQKQAQTGRISWKVSEKGALSIYGLGRFPVTLYRNQVERILAHKEDILAYIEANASKFSVKS